MKILHPVVIKEIHSSEKAILATVKYRGRKCDIWVPKKLMSYRYGAIMLPGWFLSERGFRLPPVLQVPEKIKPDDELKDEAVAVSGKSG